MPQDHIADMIMFTVCYKLQVLLFFGAPRTTVTGYLLCVCKCVKGHFVGLIANHILYLEYFPI